MQQKPKSLGRMYEYRVTKYDPSLRSESGAYLRDEWTSFDQLGESFNGVPFARAEYNRVENAYVAVALHYLLESSTGALTVCDLENSKLRAPRFVTEAAALDHAAIDQVLRNLLRGEYWCRLESNASAFIHVGWDYYMYIGVPTECRAANRLATASGLFVEEFESPYKRDAA